MGVPTSEVGYTPAMPRREDHEVRKDMWGHWKNKTLSVSATLIIQDPKRMCHTVLALSHKWHDFRKKIIEYGMCFDFLYKFI